MYSSKGFFDRMSTMVRSGTQHPSVINLNLERKNDVEIWIKVVALLHSLSYLIGFQLGMKSEGI